MNIPVKTPRMEWEGMAYISLHGDTARFHDLSIGKVESGFKDSFIEPPLQYKPRKSPIISKSKSVVKWFLNE